MHSAVANVLIKNKKYSTAEHEATTSLTTLKSVTTPDHQYVASAEYLLAISLVGQHHFKEAEPMLRENIARWNRTEAPAWRAARTESALGVTLLQLKNLPDAKQALIHAHEVLSAKDSGADMDIIATARKQLEQFKRCEAEHRLNNCEISL
jgi:Flp pilus assembly protein TadD